MINRTHLVDPLNDYERHLHDIASGQVAYKTTPCPQTGNFHSPHVIRIEDFPWATIECHECGWKALALVEDQYEDEALFDMTMVETAIPDDEYQQQGLPVHLWSEPITVNYSNGIGATIIDYLYHTHDRLPVLDSDGEVVWPV